MSSITISNSGPIVQLEIPVDHAGLVVLKGANGSGKTTALNAVESLISGEGKPPVRRGAKEAEVLGFGARLVVSGSNGRKGHFGEFKFANIEGDYSISEFVNPGVKDEKTADAKRIKSLIKMFGVEADKGLFSPLFGSEEEFDSVVQSETASVQCPVEMAARVKRDVEAAARNCEAVALDKKSKSEGLIAGLPKEFVEDGVSLEQLEAAAKSASENATEIRVKKREAEAAHKERMSAVSLLGSMEKVDLNGLVTSGAATAKRVGELKEEIAALSASLATAKELLAAEEASLALLRSRFGECEEQNKKIDEMQAKLKENLPEIPPDELVAALDVEVQECASRISAKKLHEQTKDNLEKAKRFLFEAEEQSLLAGHYRKIAAQVESQLVTIINKSGCGMSVEDGRIVLDVGDGKEFISELSEGERFRVAIKCKIAAAKSRFPDELPLVVIPQEAFEVLQPSVQKMVAEIAEAEGVVVVTALPSDDETIQVEEV